VAEFQEVTHECCKYCVHLLRQNGDVFCKIGEVVMINCPLCEICLETIKCQNFEFKYEEDD
jgi:hypothetical protein